MNFCMKDITSKFFTFRELQINVHISHMIHTTIFVTKNKRIISLNLYIQHIVLSNIDQERES